MYYRNDPLSFKKKIKKIEVPDPTIYAIMHVHFKSDRGLK